MTTMEAIKLFRSVERMVFVIAADQEMVRDAIAASLGASSRSERFAKRYLDKIVQLQSPCRGWHHMKPRRTSDYFSREASASTNSSPPL